MTNEEQILAAVIRIEGRQAAYELVAHRTLSILEMHTEKLDAILEAATAEPGPSPVVAVMKEILGVLQEQVTHLQELPGHLAITFRDELHRELLSEEPEMEPAAAWDGEPEEAPPPKKGKA